MAGNKVSEFAKNPKKALITLAIPISIAFLVQALYEVADTAFVGRLGAEAIAALTFSFPIYFILLAFNIGIGSGMGSRISRFLGEKKRKEAENTAIHGIILSFVMSAIVYIILAFFVKQIFVSLGAEGNVLMLSYQYISVILWAIFFIFMSSAFSSIFSAEGDTKTTMKVQVTSLILNIILDPILIYWMHLGVVGAAFATFFAFLLSLILYIYYIRKKSYIKIRWKSFKYSKFIMWDIIKVGAPTMVVILLVSVYVIFLTKFMAHFGTDYVASFGLVSQIESISFIPIFAFSTAALTLVGMFYGAKRKDLLKSISWYSIYAISFFTIIIGAVIYIFSPWIFRIFTNDAALIALSTSYMRIDVFTFPLMGIVNSFARIMQGIGEGFPGLAINVIRIFFVAIPLAYIFVYVLGYSFLSVAIATVIGGVASSIVSLIWLKIKLKKICD